MANKRNRKRRTWIIVVVVLILIALVFVFALARRGSTNAASKYIIQTVQTGTVTSSVSASGQLVDEYTYSVAPGTSAVLTERDGIAVGSSGGSSGGSTSGATATGGASSSGYKTTKLFVGVGDAVHADQKIAAATSDTTKKSDLEAALTSAQASLNNAFSALAADQSSYAAEKKSSTSTTQSRNAAKKQVSADYVAIDTARTSVTTATENLSGSSVIVKSPVSGHIRSITTADGASASQVATIGAGKLLVSVMVSEYDIARVQNGQSVRMSLGATKSSFDATVFSIAQLPDDSSGVEEYQVVIASGAIPAVARVGMTATASITISSHPDVLNVPASAITTSHGRSVVSVVTARGNLVVTPVTLGLVGNSTVEIDSGLRAGDRIVTGATGTVPPATITRGGPGNAG